MIIKCKADLIDYMPEYWDEIWFGEYGYSFNHSHLNKRDGNNDIIFKKLWIKDPYSFCSERYWYKTDSWLFPSARIGDYAALKRVALAIYDIIEKGKPRDPCFYSDDGVTREKWILLADLWDEIEYRYIVVDKKDLEDYKAWTIIFSWRETKYIKKRDRVEYTKKDIASKLWIDIDDLVIKE